MTRPLRIGLLVVACLALCAALLAACGGDDDKPDTGDARAEQLLSQTFASTSSAVDDARMRLAFQLDPEGLLKLGGPIKLNLGGRFAAPKRGELPRFDVDFAATLATHRFTGGVRSTGTDAFVTLDGQPYRVDDPFIAELRRGLHAEPRTGLKALGIDPRRWIGDPRAKGSEPLRGVDTMRVSGTVNVARLLEDLDSLLTKAGGPAGGGGLLSPQLRKQIAAAVDSAKVDIWTGTSDKILRQLHAVIKFRFKERGGLSPIRGLDGGTINLRLRLDDVNTTTVDVPAPSGAQPLSELTGRSIGDLVDGIRTALSDGSSGGLTGALLGCITGSGGETAPLVRCISRLAP